jgi:GTP:adenosylcobinamide-phosphate guanylyltransferase
MLEVIILAAGSGSRMQSSTAKVLHRLAGQPLICHVLGTARQLGASRIHVVVGHDADAVQAEVSAPDVQCHLQREQLGTGHAVQQAIDHCEADSTVLVLFGDVPLVREDSLIPVIRAVAFSMILGLMLVFALTGVGIILMPLFLLVAIIVAGFGGITAGYLLGKIALENISGFAPDQRSDQLKAAGLATALLFIFSLVPFLNYLAFLSLACLGTGLTMWPKIKRLLKLAP